MLSADPVAMLGESDGTKTKGQRTRRKILQAARQVFANVGYDRATIRSIAAAARVDKSSVTQYFGSKADLFREAVHWTIPIDQLIGKTPGETADNLLRGMLSAWAADPNSPMAVLMRTSMTSAEAADILRDHITGYIVPAIAATTNAADARQRAALVSAILTGIASQRYLLDIPDLADPDPEEILRLISPALHALMDPQQKATT